MTAIRSEPHSQFPSEALRQNIDDHIACSKILLDTLAQEHSALLGDEPALLEKVSDAKSRAVSSLQQLAQAFTKITGACRGAELERRIRNGGDALQQQWQTLMTLAGQCQQANLKNGALLEAKHAQVQWALSHMLGGNASERTYGPYGLNRDSGVRRVLGSV